MKESGSKLKSFIVFDIRNPEEEGSPPITYWSKGEKDSNSLLNQTGNIHDFLGFCQKFKPQAECDYISTSLHECSLLCLYGPIWMGVSIESRTSNDRFILHSILRYCRIMFSHFFVELPPLPPSYIDPSTSDHTSEDSIANVVEPQLNSVIHNIPLAFDCIVGSVNWTHLDFSYEYNSIMHQPVMFKGRDTLETACRSFIEDNHDIIEGIAIFQKRSVIYSTYSNSVTRALSYAIRKRFKLLYLPNVVPNPNKLSWIVGLYIDRNGLRSVFQYPIYYGGKTHFIIAFKLRIFKIVLTMPESLSVNEQLLLSIPRKMVKIKEVINSMYIINPPGIENVSFTHFTNSPNQQVMGFNCNEIDAASKKLSILTASTHMKGRLHLTSQPLWGSPTVTISLCIVNLKEATIRQNRCLYLSHQHLKRKFQHC